MASRFLSQGKVVLYSRGLQSFARSLRAFSSSSSGSDKRDQLEATATDDYEERSTIWPDASLGLFGPQDRRLPLPGNTGFGQHLQPPAPPPPPVGVARPSHQLEDLASLSGYERQATVMSQVAQSEDEERFLQGDVFQELESPTLNLECVIQPCPDLLKKDLASLFPGLDMRRDRPLTVITLSQHTENDMSGWSEAVENERDLLTECFISVATQLCRQLQAEGYWVDFIDPSCGRPYLGPYTNATLFETDERYRKLGFQIEDLGCCKVIRHHKWGTKAFVGSIFTDAPPGSELLSAMLKQCRYSVNLKNS